MSNSYFTNLIFSKSRIGRRQHLGLLSFLLSTITISLLLCIGAALINEFLALIFIIPGIVFPIVTSVVIKVRRLHDFDFSGWSLLLTLLPVVGVIWFLAIIVVPGSKSDNRYGEAPVPARKSDIWRILSFPIIFLIVLCFTFMHI